MEFQDQKRRTTKNITSHNKKSSITTGLRAAGQSKLRVKDNITF